MYVDIVLNEMASESRSIHKHVQFNLNTNRVEPYFLIESEIYFIPTCLWFPREPGLAARKGTCLLHLY